MHAKKSFTDEQLVASIKAGDQLAFTEVYNRYHALLLRHAVGKLGNTDLARDIVQDVFVKLWERNRDINITENLIGYLYRSVRNQIFDSIKHTKVIDAYQEAILVSNSANEVWADHHIREKQFSEMIAAEIQSLPARMREVFILRKIEYQSTKEVATNLGITENTVADQLRKAMKILKARIGLILIFLYLIISFYLYF